MIFNILSPSQQVAEHLKELIFRGEWQEELPGTPKLSEKTGVDRKTITAAIKILEEQGIIESQGTGRRRKIVLTTKQRGRGQRIHILLYEQNDRHKLFVHKLYQRLSALGHRVSLSERTLSGMQMDLNKVINYVRANSADIWIPFSASKEILEWFSRQTFDSIALFGRRRDVSIASIGPDKTAAITEVTETLISDGHRRIVLMSREERHFPYWGLQERTFAETLNNHSIPTGDFNLPRWKSNAAGLRECLEGLFRVTPPTAIILDESPFFVAAMQQLSTWGLSVPKHVSLVCTDDDLIFSMCNPYISCISWPTEPIVNHIVRWVQGVSRGKKNYKTVETPAKLVPGGTIGPANNSLPNLTEIQRAMRQI